MIRVNLIITAKWAVRSLGVSLYENQPEDISINISDKSTDNTDINYYFAFGNFKGKPTSAIDLSFFTHPDNKKFESVARKSDHCVVMCKKYEKFLISKGIDKKKITLIYPGIDQIFKPKLKVLQPVRMEVSGNRPNRKGLSLWNKVKDLPYVECLCTNGKYSVGELYELYKNTDIVLSTSILEGGPLCILEALACGCLVIAPSGVGFIDDFSEIIKYKCGDFDELENILKSKYNKKLKRYNVVKNLYISDWVENNYKLIRRLYNENNK